MQNAQMKLILLFLALLLGLSGCSTVTTTQRGLRSTIENHNKQWTAALGRGDAAGIAALYTSNARLLPANGNVVSGQPAIREYWQAAISSGFTSLTLTTLEVEACGSTAYEVGKYTVPGEGGQVLDTGEYIVIWKRDKDQWKLYRDAWTTNSPVPGQ